MSKRILLVDLSSVLYPIWHMSGSEPNVNHVSQQTVARVRGLASGYHHVAVCCDAGGKSFRHEIAPTYKANRPERVEALVHQMVLAKETLRDDGFPVWTAPGYEADDIIATATRLACERLPYATVVIASSDKDLMQLVSARVTQFSLTNGGTHYGPDDVLTKFGVTPQQMRDYLVLVGDKADNVEGVAGIGPVGAAKILSKFGSLQDLVRRLGEGAPALGLTLNMHKALQASVIRMEIGRKLISLANDVDIPFDELLAPRVPRSVATFNSEMNEDMDMVDYDGETGEVIELQEVPPATPAAARVTTTMASAPTAAPEPTAAAPTAAAQPAAPVEPASGPSVRKTMPEAEDVRPSVALAAPSWKSELEPRTLGQAGNLAKMMFDSKIFLAYGTPQAVLSVILMGRELGIGAMASLRGFHIIEGKPSMSAALMHALVLQSGKAKFFTCTHRSNDKATFRTLRVGPDEQPLEISYSMDDAKRAGLIKAGSGWEKNPADMLVARAIAILARLRYPDVCLGLYTPEELGHEELEQAA
jgi:5'-3' exonuclease